DPTAERDEQRVAPAARCEQGVEHALQHLPGLGLLSVRNRNVNDAGARLLQAQGDSFKVERRHDVVGDDRGAAAKVGTVELRSLEQPGADVNRGGALAQGYAERFHSSSRRSTRSRTRDCTPCAPVSTTRSATPR